MKIDNSNKSSVLTLDYIKSQIAFNNGKEQTDFIRSNKFYVMFHTGYDNFDPDNSERHIGAFVKSFTIPPLTKSFVTFKRMGKTIKIPRNNDISDDVNISFHADSNMKVLTWLSNIYYMGENKPLTKDSQEKLFGKDNGKKWSMTVYYIRKNWITKKGEKTEQEYDKEQTILGTAKSFVPRINTPIGNINIFKEDIKTPHDIFDTEYDAELGFVMRFDDIFINNLQSPEFNYSSTDTLGEFNAIFGYSDAYFGDTFVNDKEERTYELVKQQLKDQLLINN